MTNSVSVVDYGVGNLLSVRRALEAVGANVTLVQSGAEVAAAERLILPGVGAFGKCMDEIRVRGLADSILDFARSGRPFLGICVGMQIMMSVGTEFGQHVGLGLIEGTVDPIPRTGPTGRANKVPHIGWNGVFPTEGGSARWQAGILQDLTPGNCVYFVHSFMARPRSAEAVLATAHYNGLEVTAAVQTGTCTGLQFHPEKSGPAGLTILGRFMRS